MTGMPPYDFKKPKTFEMPPDKKVRKKGVCAAMHCRKVTHIKEKYCSCHKMRRFKLRNPIKYAFGKLRTRAKERGHAFSLTLEEWTRFWNDNNLGELRGKAAERLTVDRKKSHLGYSYDNLQPLTNRENGTKSDRDDWQPELISEGNAPF